MKKILTINIVSFILILCFAELISGYQYYKKIKDQLNLKHNAGLIQNFRYKLPIKDIYPYCYQVYFKNYISADKNTPPPRKRPVLFLGCSYIYGSGLKDEQTLPYKIHKQTDRDCYKRGIPGGGIQLALDMFEKGIIQKQVPDVEYIIYVYVDYHISRLYAYQLDYLDTEVNQRYKLKNDKLVKINKPIFPIYYSSFLVKQIQKYIEKITRENEYTDYKLFNAIMAELLSQAKKNYKDIKFVILLYPSADLMNTDNENIPEHEIEKLKSMGFIVINAEDLTKEPIRNLEYRTPDRDHPAENAWDAILPELIKQLNL
ncbi:MAG: hypothetical protein ACI37T_08610 [Candidatus Gastranaerophilaceae bacterium]